MVGSGCGEERPFLRVVGWTNQMARIHCTTGACGPRRSMDGLVVGSTTYNATPRTNPKPRACDTCTALVHTTLRGAPFAKKDRTARSTMCGKSRTSRRKFETEALDVVHRSTIGK